MMGTRYLRAVFLLGLLATPTIGIAKNRSPGPVPQLAVAVNGALWTMRADGTGRRRLTPTGTADSPQLSPNGKLVAYDRVAAACSPPRPPGSDGPAPMPNLLTVVSATNRARSWSVCGGSPAWSPTSRLLAYFNGEMLIVRAADSRYPRVLLRPDRFYGYASLSWSPNGKAIAVPLYGPGSGLFQDRTLRLAIVPLHGAVRRITIHFPAGALGANNWIDPNAAHGSYPTYTHLAWARDSRHLLISTLSNGREMDITGIWEAPSSGGMARLVAGTEKGIRTGASSVAALDRATRVNISPTGSLLATNANGRLWAGALDGRHGRILASPVCPVRQMYWLGDNSGLAYITACTHHGRYIITLATVRLVSPAPHVLLRGPSLETDMGEGSV